MELNVGDFGKRLAILLTCHNRREKTFKCLNYLLAENDYSINIETFLVDDGCTDGTSQMVEEKFPKVHILKGNGTLFWNKGMNLAFQTAIKSKFDFYLWVNDDVQFYPNIIPKLVEAYLSRSINKKDIIIVGPTLDKTESINTYGGFKEVKSIIPYKVQRIYMNDKFQKCLIFHGNCVLIPNCVVDKIGINDEFYQHGYGDSDYALQANKAGCEIWLANFPVGICERHDDSFKFLDPSLPFKERYISLHSKVNHPKSDLLHFSKKFWGPLWLYKYLSADIRLVISSAVYKIKHIR